eukprot:1184095-Amphidinium_carterae.1
MQLSPQPVKGQKQETYNSKSAMYRFVSTVQHYQLIPKELQDDFEDSMNLHSGSKLKQPAPARLSNQKLIDFKHAGK